MKCLTPTEGSYRTQASEMHLPVVEKDLQAQRYMKYSWEGPVQRDCLVLTLRPGNPSEWVLLLVPVPSTTSV